VDFNFAKHSLSTIKELLHSVELKNIA